MPPRTDVKAHQAASRKARRRSASIMGISITSGGTGKNELSAKETRPRMSQACRPDAFAIVQSYRARSVLRLGAAVLSLISSFPVRGRAGQAAAPQASFAARGRIG